VPDFISADWLRAQPRIEQRNNDGDRRRGRNRIGGGFHWAIHQAVIAQRLPRVIIPDVLLGQVFWGGERNRWPSNWRNSLFGRLKSYTGGPESPFMGVTLTDNKEKATCSELCSLHDSGIRHRHFSILIRTEHDIGESDKLDDAGQPSEDAWFSRVFMGVLELYGFDKAQNERVYDFTLQAQKTELDEESFKTLNARIRAFRSKGRLASVYLPLRLFGGSPLLGLSFQQRQLMFAVHRELTRDRKSTRQDKADVILMGKSTGKSDSFAIDHYPGLEDRQRYVGFNGNGGARRERFRGRGYRILGDKGWLVRARYVSLGETEDAWEHVRSLLKDLQYVGEMFGLVVAGRHQRTGDWLFCRTSRSNKNSDRTEVA
jgi:hypothetical protein